MKKTIKTAIFSSLIIALYGLIPIALLDNFEPKFFIIGFLLLSTIAIVFWLVNIFFTKYYSHKPVAFQYGISYFTTTFMNFILFIILKTNTINKSENILMPIFFGIAINTIILIILNSITSGQQKQKAEQELQKLQIKNMEAQQMLLMQQLQPHFLFNSLSTLKSLININAADAEKYTIQLSEFLRYSITAHNNKIVTLEQELNFAQNYINLQKVRFGEAIQYHLQIDKEFVNFKIPVFAIQLLLENAIKHNAYSNYKKLIIDVKIENNVLIISNNKIEATENNSIGIGLKNLNERYKLLAGKEIKIENSQNQFTVYLNLLP